MKNIFQVLFILLLFLCSCNNGKKNAAETPAAYREYLELKNALVSSDPKSAQKEAGDFSQALKQLPDSSSQEVQFVIQKTSGIANTENLEEQRQLFSMITEPLLKLAKAGILGKSDFYVQHCPMAFNNKGANWLSNEKEIKNPYFGDEMLSCGEVIEEVK